ncbi:MAG: hypothetical protein JSU06_12675 [Actinobacteria bacterium]|nr:hypothetical protein [Actinomycetota bacterium]
MPARLLVPLVTVAALLALAPGAAAAGAFRHDLSRVNAHLRIAIEYAPEELGKTVASAETVCALGERAAAAGDPGQAAADWMALEQLVAEDVTEASQRIETAFANGDSALRTGRERAELEWSAAPSRLRALRHGVAETRRGIATMRAVVAGLATPFASWRAHECAAAIAGIKETFVPAPFALELINNGMLRLWRLSMLPPLGPNG